MKQQGKVAAVVVAFVFTLALTGDSAASSNFTVGSATGIRGGEVEVPLYLVLSSGQQFQRVIATVSYPPVLTYKKVGTDKETASSGVSIIGKNAGTEAGDKMKRVAITIAAEKGKLLPTLVIGSVAFAVDKKAQQQRISLPVTAIKGFLKGGGTGSKIHGNPGSVVIYESAIQQQPLAGCFFFSH